MRSLHKRSVLLVEYGELVEHVRWYLAGVHEAAELFITAIYDLGVLLSSVETTYGEGTIHRLATDVNRSESYLYKAKAFAEAWTAEALSADMAMLRAQGRIPSLSYYWRQLSAPGQYAVESLERRAMILDADCEEVKATFVETPAIVEAVESIQVIVQETNRDLHDRVAEGVQDAYRNWLRQQPCIFCQSSPCDVAHLPISKGAGGLRVLPVCHEEHMLLHQVGLATFLGMDLVSVERVERLLILMADLFLACYSRRNLP